MQVDRKERDKQKEKRRLQIILYMRVSFRRVKFVFLK